MKSFKQHLNESSLSRLWSHTKNYDTGTISAFRDALDCNNGDKLTRGKNKARNQVLKAKLLKAGFGVTTVAGTYIENYGTSDAIEVAEESFFVVDHKEKGTLLKTLKKLGEEFEQDSITFSVKGGEDYVLIGTNRCDKGYPGYGVKIKLGKAFFSDSGEFFSKVNGRPFVFKNLVKEDETYEGAGSSRGKQAITSLSEVTWQDHYELNSEILEA
jgi:hypothetical protein